jgi:hypothetical protein
MPMFFSEQGFQRGKYPTYSSLSYLLARVQGFAFNPTSCIALRKKGARSNKIQTKRNSGKETLTREFHYM